MKVIKILVAIILAEVIIALPVLAGIYAWSMMSFVPAETTECSRCESEICENETIPPKDWLVPIKDVCE